MSSRGADPLFVSSNLDDSTRVGGNHARLRHARLHENVLLPGIRRSASRRPSTIPDFEIYARSTSRAQRSRVSLPSLYRRSVANRIAGMGCFRAGCCCSLRTSSVRYEFTPRYSVCTSTGSGVAEPARHGVHRRMVLELSGALPTHERECRLVAASARRRLRRPRTRRSRARDSRSSHQLIVGPAGDDGTRPCQAGHRDRRGAREPSAAAPLSRTALILSAVLRRMLWRNVLRPLGR